MDNIRQISTDELCTLKEEVDKELSKRAQKLAEVSGLKIKVQRKRVGRNVDEGKSRNT